MKTLLILLTSLTIIAFTHTCYGQKTVTFEEADSLNAAGKFVIALFDSVNHIIYYQIPETDTLAGVFTYTPPPTLDTVLVILLMSDTSEHSADNLGQVYWDLGYEVRKTFSSFTSYKGASVHDFDHINYLDIDKKELPKKLIVWQSKQF